MRASKQSDSSPVVWSTAAHSHANAHAYSSSSSGSTERVASSVNVAPSLSNTSPPTITARRGAASTKKSKLADAETAGFAACQASNFKAYDVPGGNDFFRRNNCVVSDLVVFGSSVTDSPSDRDADHANAYPEESAHAAPIFSTAAMIRESFPRAIAPFTTELAAMLTAIEHSVHVTPSPSYPSGHAPHVRPTPSASGAGTSKHSTPAKHGDAAHPSTSTHPESPLDPGSNPAPPYGQSPHTIVPELS